MSFGNISTKSSLVKKGNFDIYLHCSIRLDTPYDTCKKAASEKKFERWIGLNAVFYNLLDGSAMDR
jgi:hypothetical protein